MDRTSIVVTTGPSASGRTFGDLKTAVALFDRLTHYRDIVETGTRASASGVTPNT